ncbi:hypothetical protein P175DRAFT_0528664 [Aspergillus ochraceoroseus IBT 24754]|uniref:Uncharacterized protein n=1 Tax=Aspergillus ochraceoroseus IBT 24754 TaxID=1392256 RepID=A0A2T5M9D4_9EURO|nr:uncharacterized protein P175DRAFT_0528664 [Aspergillus ochraceoroseus IBT 24754]PTU25134.1 hypothetical protein P175DRAFT_0528664 [Aspergillus ochraceoroseus IBT 24754]
MALFGLPNPISLAALWSIQSLPEQMEHITGRIGAAIDKSASLLSRAHGYNLSLMPSSFWAELSACKDTLLADTIPKSSPATDIHGPEGYPPGLTMLPLNLSYEEYSVDTVDPRFTPSSLSDWDSGQLLAPSPRSPNFPDFSELSWGSLMLAGLFLLFLLLIPICASVRFMKRVAVARQRQAHLLQIANHEILGFIRSIYDKKDAIMEKMNITVSAIEYQIEEAFQQIAAEKERVCTDFPFVLEQEVNLLRDALQIRVRSEFEHQVSKIKEFIADVERRRRSLPSPQEIEDTCEAFLDELGRLIVLVNDLRSRIHDERKAYIGSQKLHQQMDSMVCPCRARCNVRSEGPQRSAAVADHPARVSAKKDEVLQDNPRLDPPEAREPRYPSLALWRMTKESAGLTAEELEQGRKVRRERVEKRLAESACGYPSPWDRLDGRKGRQKHTSKSKLQ